MYFSSALHYRVARFSAVVREPYVSLVIPYFVQKMKGTKNMATMPVLEVGATFPSFREPT